MQVGYEVGVRTCIHVNPLGRVYASRVHTSGDATPQWEDVLIRVNVCSVVLNLVLVYKYTGKEIN